jgi:hypothetical protein
LKRKNGDYAACLKYSVLIFVEKIFKMERLEVSGAVRHVFPSLSGKGLERTGYSHLKDKAVDRTMWRARFGRGFGPVVRQTTK